MEHFSPTRSLQMIAILFCLFLSCKETPKDAEHGEKAPIAVFGDTEFQALWEKVDLLWEKRESGLVNTVYAEDFVRISPAGTSTSVEELTNEMNAINGAYPDMTLELERYDIRGNMVVVHWSVDGTFTGELAGVQGNGKPFSNVVGVSILKVKNGKIVKDDSYWDTFAVFAQAGYTISSPKI